jgi:hypothetical protein
MARGLHLAVVSIRCRSASPRKTMSSERARGCPCVRYERINGSAMGHTLNVDSPDLTAGSSAPSGLLSLASSPAMTPSPHVPN